MHLGDILPLLFQILSLNIGTYTEYFIMEMISKWKTLYMYYFDKAKSEINKIFWGVTQPPG